LAPYLDGQRAARKTEGDLRGAEIFSTDKVADARI
jgi:hypothetical protein